jgi:hypothetical protein
MVVCLFACLYVFVSASVSNLNWQVRNSSGRVCWSPVQSSSALISSICTSNSACVYVHVLVRASPLAAGLSQPLTNMS